jgi:enoyl-CoA hydratase/carnithine racemase
MDMSEPCNMIHITDSVTADWARRAHAHRGREVTLQRVDPARSRAQGSAAHALDDAIAWVEIHDPGHRNALSEAVTLGLLARLQEISERPEIKVAVIIGRDDVFLGGALEGGPRGALPLLQDALLRCEIPVIAAMQGHAEGAGFCFGLSADLLVLGEAARYSAGALGPTLGAAPDLAAHVLRRALGATLAAELLHLGASYTGLELRDRGASLLVRPNAEVGAAALAMARQVADKPRDALALLKRALAGRQRAAPPAAPAPAPAPLAPAPIARERIRLRPRSAVLEPPAPAPIERPRVALRPRFRFTPGTSG